jgi:hypothetical protein
MLRTGDTKYLDTDLRCFDVIFGAKTESRNRPDCPSCVSLALFCKKKFFCRALSTVVEKMSFTAENAETAEVLKYTTGQIMVF